MTETNVFSVTCPSCSTGFPVDASKVPEAGVLARCSVCNGVFRVEAPVPEPAHESFSVGSLTDEPAPEPVPTFDTLPAPAAEPEPSFQAPAPPTPEVPTSDPIGAPTDLDPTPPVFGKRDPKEKARRLARVLVSDMITYNADRHARALANGTLKADFEEEIHKSWSEYVDQVGAEVAESTPFFNDALNEILARGEAVF